MCYLLFREEEDAKKRGRNPCMMRAVWLWCSDSPVILGARSRLYLLRCRSYVQVV